jgi:hypothetical protein
VDGTCGTVALLRLPMSDEEVTVLCARASGHLAHHVFRVEQEPVAQMGQRQTALLAD